MSTPSHLPNPALPRGAGGAVASLLRGVLPDGFSDTPEVRPLSATFRNILLVVFLILVFAVVQMVTLWAVCNVGMKTAATLEHQGLPALNDLASLQEHLVAYRLQSYEVLFAHEGEKAAKMKAAEAVAAQTHLELENIERLFTDGDGQRLAVALHDSFNALDVEFGKVRSLVDVDFAVAMKTMDRDIPPLIERVSAAANALKTYGYRLSGGQANATFGSFGWIKKNAVAFGAGNILVAFGAVMFVLLAARRSRAQLAHTLGRLDERTQELAGSLSVVNATLEATADGIVLIDAEGHVKTYNRQFAAIWDLPEPKIPGDRRELRAMVLPLLKDPRKMSGVLEWLAANPESESADVLELVDGRFLESCSKPQRIENKICGRVWSIRDITERKRMQGEVEQAHAQLVVASRQAGMAEVATGVLHNVGNVLNSVNVSATLVADQIRQTKAAGIAKLAAMFEAHRADLAAFLTADARGRMIPGYLGALAESLAEEHATMLKEIEHLRKNIEHIKDIVAMQQNYATKAGFVETVPLVELVEDALRMNAGSFTRHDIEVVCDFESRPLLSTDKHKVMQILINLLRNARQACDESGAAAKRIAVRTKADGARVRIAVNDNGIGIPPENLTRIFNHGFTTRTDGHGFGLHSGALAAKEIGGSLSVSSDGPGRGATFTLELPLAPQPTAGAASS